LIIPKRLLHTKITQGCGEGVTLTTHLTPIHRVTHSE
jgi:hypothetical protein